MTDRRIRVLVGKPGLDGHDRGAKVIARGLRDAGMEVIYTGLHRTPAQIVEAARDEDVDVIGLSVLSGAHERLFSEVVERLKVEEMSDVLVVGGGIIPDADVPRLLELGVAAVFAPGSPLTDIISFIQEHAPARWS